MENASVWIVKGGYHAADPTGRVVAYGKTAAEAGAALEAAIKRNERLDYLVAVRALPASEREGGMIRE